MIAVVDVRGWLCPVAAWEVGIAPDRLVVVRCPDRSDWSKVTASLIEGFPRCTPKCRRIPPTPICVVSALWCGRASPLSSFIRFRVTSPPVCCTFVSKQSRCDGRVPIGGTALCCDDTSPCASGKGARGIEQVVELEDDGSHAVRVVSPIGRCAARTRRRIGLARSSMHRERWLPLLPMHLPWGASGDASRRGRGVGSSCGHPDRRSRCRSSCVRTGGVGDRVGGPGDGDGRTGSRVPAHRRSSALLPIRGGGDAPGGDGGPRRGPRWTVRVGRRTLRRPYGCGARSKNR